MRFQPETRSIEGGKRRLRTDTPSSDTVNRLHSSFTGRRPCPKYVHFTTKSTPCFRGWSPPKACPPRCEIGRTGSCSPPRGCLAGKSRPGFSYTTDTVRTWTDRFNAEGLRGLFDRPRSGAPRRLTVEAVLEVVQA